MFSAVNEALPAEVAIFVAAVSDWKIENVQRQKIKKSSGQKAPSLVLAENKDILSYVSNLKQDRPKLVIGFSKVTLFFLTILIIYSIYQAKDFNLDASSDALLLEGDPDLRYLREVNQRYGSKDFLVLTYTPVLSFTEKETIINLQLLKSKIEKLTWVDSVITIIDVPLLKSTDESLMERLKNYKTLSYPEIDKKRAFEEIINSPIYRNYVISEDGKTSGIVVYLKKDERLNAVSYTHLTLPTKRIV